MKRALLIVAAALILTPSAVMATPDDGTVIGPRKIVDNGSDAERFDIVLLAEGYTSEELESFATHAQAFADALFGVPASALRTARLSRSPGSASFSSAIFIR